MRLKYKGSYGWLLFWTLVCPVITMYLVFDRGIVMINHEEQEQPVPANIYIALMIVLMGLWFTL